MKLLFARWAFNCATGGHKLCLYEIMTCLLVVNSILFSACEEQSTDYKSLPLKQLFSMLPADFVFNKELSQEKWAGFLYRKISDPDISINWHERTVSRDTSSLYFYSKSKAGILNYQFHLSRFNESALMAIRPIRHFDEQISSDSIYFMEFKNGQWQLLVRGYGKKDLHRLVSPLSFTKILHSTLDKYVTWKYYNDSIIVTLDESILRDFPCASWDYISKGIFNYTLSDRGVDLNFSPNLNVISHSEPDSENIDCEVYSQIPKNFEQLFRTPSGVMFVYDGCNYLTSVEFQSDKLSTRMIVSYGGERGFSEFRILSFKKLDDEGGWRIRMIEDGYNESDITITSYEESDNVIYKFNWQSEYFFTAGDAIEFVENGRDLPREKCPDRAQIF